LLLRCTLRDYHQNCLCWYLWIVAVVAVGGGNGVVVDLNFAVGEELEMMKARELRLGQGEEPLDDSCRQTWYPLGVPR